MDKTFIVLYRTGGWASCTWQSLYGTYIEAEAGEHVRKLDRQGYKALSRSVAEHDLLGMPIGWHWRLVDHTIDAISVGKTITYHTVHHARHEQVKALMEKEGIQ